ncbi:MAG: hypothetical protein U9Q31_01210 [Chloroflexota bacterium]|nr:hypothetical protein [Chloroflexota bacterium]
MAYGAKFTVYIPEKNGADDLKEKLQKLADKQDRSLNYIVVKALEEYVK